MELLSKHADRQDQKQHTTVQCLKIIPHWHAG